jgi:hypothetical protein
MNNFARMISLSAAALLAACAQNERIEVDENGLAAVTCSDGKTLTSIIAGQCTYTLQGNSASGTQLASAQCIRGSVVCTYNCSASATGTWKPLEKCAVGDPEGGCPPYTTTQQETGVTGSCTSGPGGTGQAALNQACATQFAAAGGGVILNGPIDSKCTTDLSNAFPMGMLTQPKNGQCCAEF